MKRLLIMLVILVSVIASGQAQDKLKIGEVKNGKFVLTNPDALKAFFMNSLGKSGTLGKDFQVNSSPEGDRFFVFYPVTGNNGKVNNIGVMLVKIKNDAFIVVGSPESAPGGPGAGGSFEVQCFGTCTSCMPNIKWIGGNWLPVVYCDCTQGGSGECNMITKIVIRIEV